MQSSSLSRPMCAVSAVQCTWREMGIGSERRRPRFINFVGSFREPGSNATLTGWMLGCWMLDGDLQAGPGWVVFFSQRARRARSITVGPTGREQATNGGRRGGVWRRVSESR